MVLDECVKTYREDAILYIGASSGYFFIGTPKEYNEIIDSIFDEYKSKIELTLKSRQRDLEKLLETTSKDDPSFKVQKKGIEERIKRARNALNGFIPFRDREVKEEYKKALGGYAIIIKGYGTGKYWALDEWRRDHESSVG